MQGAMCSFGGSRSPLLADGAAAAASTDGPTAESSQECFGMGGAAAHLGFVSDGREVEIPLGGKNPVPLPVSPNAPPAIFVTNSAEAAHYFPVPPPRPACIKPVMWREREPGAEARQEERGGVDERGRGWASRGELRAVKDAGKDASAANKENRSGTPSLFFKYASHPFRRAAQKKSPDPAGDRHRRYSAIEPPETSEVLPAPATPTGLRGSQGLDQADCRRSRSVSGRRPGSPDTLASEVTLVSQRQDSDLPRSGTIAKSGSNQLSFGSVLVTEAVSTELVRRFPADLIAALGVVVRDVKCINSGVLWPSGQTAVKCKKVVDPATGRRVIHSATLPALIHFLACEGEPDHDFADDFLRTYQYFTTALDVARLLVIRYLNASMSIAECVQGKCVLPPMRTTAAAGPRPGESGSQKHEDSWEAEGGKEAGDTHLAGACKRPGGVWTNATAAASRDGWDRAIQFRVIGFIKRWVDSRPGDFSRSGAKRDCGYADADICLGVSSALEVLWLFLETIVLPDENFSSFGRNVLQKLSDAETAWQVPRPAKDFMLMPLTARTLRIPKSDSACVLKIEEMCDAANLLPSPVRPTHRPFLPSFSGTKSRPSFISHCRAKSLPSMTLKVSEEKDGAAPLSGLDPVHLAQELAILEHGAFSKIKVPEFINQAWMSSPGMREAKAPNLRRFILWFDRVAYGCATEVLRYRDATTRALAISAFIITARHCLNKLRAYNTCFEIMAGLGLGPVRRLRDTWDAVPRKFRREFEYISRLVSSEDNHREYRKRLKEDAEKTGSWDGPWVPYLGVNLKDQVFAEVGNPSYLPPDAEHKDAEACSLPVVNLCKFRRISHLLRSIVIAQQGTYRAASRPDVLRWISDVLACPQTEGELYLRSRELEGGGSGVKIRDVWPPPPPPPPPPPAPHAPAAQAEAPAGATTASSPAAVVTPARARAPRLRLQCNSAFECEVLLDAAEDECSVPPSPAWSSPLSFSAASTVCSEEAWAYRDAA